jgi:hypothetical protein
MNKRQAFKVLYGRDYWEEKTHRASTLKNARKAIGYSCEKYREHVLNRLMSRRAGLVYSLPCVYDRGVVG